MDTEARAQVVGDWASQFLKLPLLVVSLFIPVEWHPFGPGYSASPTGIGKRAGWNWTYIGGLLVLLLLMKFIGKVLANFDLLLLSQTAEAVNQPTSNFVDS